MHKTFYVGGTPLSRAAIWPKKELLGHFFLPFSHSGQASEAGISLTNLTHKVFTVKLSFERRGGFDNPSDRKLASNR
jgi:hypothetical protein